MVQWALIRDRYLTNLRWAKQIGKSAMAAYSFEDLAPRRAENKAVGLGNPRYASEERQSTFGSSLCSAEANKPGNRGRGRTVRESLSGRVGGRADPCRRRATAAKA